MKRMFLSMLAAVTLFASCSQEEVVSQQQATGEESLVSFTVTTPQLGSRALGDGTTATDLYFAVYDETTATPTIVSSISSNTTKYVDFANKKANITLPLLNGHKYSLLFWAESAACPYTVNWEEKTIALDANATLKSNQEVYDAFYAYVEPFIVTGDKSETIYLYRPFAQLNIGTTDKDIERVKEYFNVTVFDKTTVEVTDVPTKMNLATGIVDENSKQDLTYDASEYASLTGFPVDGYTSISMNYILVGTEKITTSVTLTTDVQGLEERTYVNVPLQNNYRTNIYGELFTSESNWNVEIDNEFDTPDYEILDGVLDLTADMELTSSYRVTNSLAINLNGNTLSYGVKDILMRVENGATLTINGPGKIVSELSYIASANEGGTIYVNGGEYSASTTCFQTNGGNLYISGGYFDAWNVEYQGKYTLNKKDRTQGEIVVKGGGFYKFNPGQSSSENPTADFVPDGYSVTTIGDVYYVAKTGAEVATTADNLATALASTTSSEVAMVANVETTTSFTIGAGKTLNGQGNTLTLDVDDDGTYAVGLNANGGKIENLVIDGQNQKSTTNEKGYRAILIRNVTENVVIDNVTIDGVAYCLNTAGTIADGLTLSVSNSTLIGWSSWDKFASASFEFCKFGVGSYYDSATTAIAGQEHWNGCIRPYVTTTFKNCEFGKDFVLMIDKLAADATLTFVNCTVNGVALTALSQLGVTATDTRVTIK